MADITVIQDNSRPTTGYGTPKKRRDVSGRPKGVFRLADTVPDSWIGQGPEGEALKERIAGLLGGSNAGDAGVESGKDHSTRTSAAANAQSKEIPPKTETSAGPTSQKGLEQISESGMVRDDGGTVFVDKGKGRSLDEGVSSHGREATQPRSSQTTVPIEPSTSGNSISNPPRTPPRKTSASSGLKYRVVVPPTTSRRLNGLPPPVLSYTEVEAKANSFFSFVDAQAVNSQEANKGKQKTVDFSDDPQMAAFEGMLQEYLKLEQSNGSMTREEEEQYVYDLYYRDMSGDSTALALGAGDGVAPQSVGALLDFDLLSPPSTPSSSEPEDEADEDSNDEDFYRNDYPEDEDADEDMESFEDAFASDGDEEDDDDALSGSERGKWDYR